MINKIPRIFTSIREMIEPGKVLVIFGSRRVGKTTLVVDFLRGYTGRYRSETGDDIIAREVLGSQDLQRLRAYVKGYDLLFIDEAQRIPNIGIGLKLLVDSTPTLTIIATGSSSFELLGQVGEPLTGRKRTVTLFPLSEGELLSHAHGNRHDLSMSLPDRMIYGSYPDVITAETHAEKLVFLEEITSSYLLKDILEFEKVKNSRVLIDMLKMLALQIGGEVSYSELGTALGVDNKTVARYLDLLEKSFVIYRLGGYSRNLRKEITKKNKYYFYDLGIRNALISNFNDFSKRDDVGALFENYMVIERLKMRKYSPIYANDYFWRTWDGQEVDLVEERDGKLFGFEFKWNKSKVKEPSGWRGTYHDAEYCIITKDNYQDIVLHTIANK